MSAAAKDCLPENEGAAQGTIQHLKNVIASFANGEVEITELHGPIHDNNKICSVGNSEHRLYRRHKAAIDEIIPAHIGYTILLQFNRWSDYAGNTWAELATKTWAEIAEDDLNA